MWYFDALYLPSNAWIKNNYLDLLGIVLSLIAAWFAWYGPYHFSKADKIYHLQRVIDDPSRSDITIKKMMRSLALSWFSVKSLEFLHDQRPQTVIVSWYITEKTINEEAESIRLMHAWLDNIKEKMRNNPNDANTSVVRYLLIQNELIDDDNSPRTLRGDLDIDFWKLVFPKNGNEYIDNEKIKFIRMKANLKADVCLFEISPKEKIVQFRDDSEGSDVYFDIKFSKAKSDVKKVEKIIQDYESEYHGDEEFSDQLKENILSRLNNDNQGNNNV